ncbi:MAG: hypothetical protein JXR73_03895 [Candidatus Omnitrophica bacterium]|nr:hypothetical protein [Candidatus Omnitrophota bacterium]
MISFLNANPIISLFVIVASGIALGHINIKGFSFGSSAVIFTGILFGHLGAKLPAEINTLGVILFVYAIGLQAGPRFFRTIYRYGLSYFVIALASLLSGIITVWICVKIMGIDEGLGIGIFPGALTSTPGLAAALDVKKDPNISIGYGVAYPFGVIGVVIFVQLIAMMKKTANEMKEESEQSRHSESSVCIKQFLVTNPNFTGKPLVEIELHSMTQANITRIKHGDKIFMAHGDAILHLNDTVRAVGTPRELKKLEHLIGSETETPMDTSLNLVTRDVFISSPQFVGKTIRQLEIHSLYGVVLTRLQRDEMEVVPTGSTMLEIGDLVRVVGDKEDCDYFVTLFGQTEKRIHETNLLPLTIGIVLGGILGSHYFTLPGGIQMRLGMSGGPLLVALIVSHFGKIGRLRTRVPYAAKYLTREIGLVFFLAGAGVSAGGSFWSVMCETGPLITVIGLLTTIIPMGVAYLMSVYMFKLGNLAAIGVVCGAMTMTPALGVVSSKIDSKTPPLAYTAIYPIAMVLVTVYSQILAMILS